MNTPYFRARCNSMLRYIALKDKISEYSIDDYEIPVIRQLVADGKIQSLNFAGLYHLVVVNATPYGDDNTDTDPQPNPIVFHLASENPANEEFVRVYRKNWYVPPMPDLTSEVVNDTIAE